MWRIAKPDDHILPAKVVEFRGKMGTMAVENKKPILPYYTVACVFVKDLCKPLIAQDFISPPILTEANDPIVRYSGSVPG